MRLGLLSLIPFFTVKDSEYVQWHAKQGLAFTICAFAYFVVTTILLIIIGLVSATLAMILSLLLLIPNLAMLAAVVYAIIKALAPSRWKIPGVSIVAEKFLGQKA